MSKHVKEIDSSSFAREVLESDIPVMVDFFATWCAPCKALSPIVEGLAQELEGEVLFVKLDVDESPEIARKYGVSAMPTLVVFDQGEPTMRHVGMATRSRLLDLLLDAIS